MESSETGAGGTGEMPAAEVQPAAPPPAGAATAGKQPRNRDGMLIALIAISCIALVLLGSTITLALVGDFGGGGPGLRVERPGLQNMDQTQRPGVEQRREMREERIENFRDRVKDRLQEDSPEDKSGDQEPADTTPGGTAPETRAARTA